MKRSGVLFTGGAVLVLVAGYLVVGLTSPERGAGEPAGLEPTTSEPSTASPVAGPLPPPEPVDAEDETAPRVSVSDDSEDPVPAEHHDEVFIHGTVTDEAGSPIAEAPITVKPDEGERGLEVHTDEKGAYHISPVAPGTRRLRAHPDGYLSGDVQLEITGAEPLVRHDFQLDREQRIFVHLVTEQGQPVLELAAQVGLDPVLLNLLPVATREEPGEAYRLAPHRSVRQGIGKYFDCFGLRAYEDRPTIFGFIELLEPGPGWVNLVAGGKVLRKQPFDRAIRKVTFVVELEELQAIVCEIDARLVAAETGQPLAGRAWIEGPGTGHFPIEVGSDGTLFFERVSPSSGWLVASFPERADVRIPLELTPGERLELGDVPVPPPVRLRGKVTRSTGEPAEVQLHWGRLGPATGEVAWERWYHSRSRKSGLFSIPKLAPGFYVITAPRLPEEQDAPPEDWVAAPQRVDATQGTVEGIELVLRRSSVVALVLPEVESDRLLIEAHADSGLVVGKTTLARPDREAWLRLVPGTYELVVSYDDEVVHREPLYVGSGPERIELSF